MNVDFRLICGLENAPLSFTVNSRCTPSALCKAVRMLERFAAEGLPFGPSKTGRGVDIVAERSLTGCKVSIDDALDGLTQKLLAKTWIVARDSKPLHSLLHLPRQRRIILAPQRQRRSKLHAHTAWPRHIPA